MLYTFLYACIGATCGAIFWSLINGTMFSGKKRGPELLLRLFGFCLDIVFGGFMGLVAGGTAGFIYGLWLMIHGTHSITWLNFK